jgi:hypothetical protein
MSLLVLGVNGCEPFVKVSCNDSDVNAAIGQQYVKGTVTISSSQSTDFCLDETQLAEYGCSNSALTMSTVSCPNGCQDGACVSAEAGVEIGGEAKPDLIITDITFKKSVEEISGPPGVASSRCIDTNLADLKVGDTLCYYVTTKNIGSSFNKRSLSQLEISPLQSQRQGTASNSWVYNPYHGSIAPMPQESGKLGLNSNEESTYQDYFTINSTQITLTATADVENVIDESDETNNQLTKTIYIGTTSTCTDSDGGKDYYVKGEVGVPSGGGTGYMMDCCLDENFQCVPSSDILRETYCSEGRGVGESYTCPNGCSDGACLSAPTGGKPDLIVSALDTTYYENWFTFVANITNIGTATAGNFSVDFFVDGKDVGGFIEEHFSITPGYTYVRMSSPSSPPTQGVHTVNVTVIRFDGPPIGTFGSPNTTTNSLTKTINIVLHPAQIPMPTPSYVYDVSSTNICTTCENPVDMRYLIPSETRPAYMGPVFGIGILTSIGFTKGPYASNIPTSAQFVISLANCQRPIAEQMLTINTDKGIFKAYLPSMSGTGSTSDTCWAYLYVASDGSTYWACPNGKTCDTETTSLLNVNQVLNANYLARAAP